MKIGVLHPYYKKGLVGGGETLILQIKDYMTKKGIEMEIISLDLDFNNPLHKFGLSPVLQTKVYLSGLSKKLRDVDIIHSHFSYATLPFSLRKKTILTFHGYIGDIFSSRKVCGVKGILRSGYYQFQKYYEYLNARSAERITAVSQFLKNRLVEDMHIEPKKINVIRNGVDLVEIGRSIGTSPFKNGEFNIFFLGRVTHQKGIDLLLNAIKQLKINGLNLYISGPLDDRTLKQQLDNMILTHNLKVKYIGAVPDRIKFSYLRHADAVIIPSRWEGFGIVATEALASSAAIISSDIGPLKEVLGDAAIYFKSGDSDDLRTQIVRLVGDQNFQKTLRTKAIERSKEFDINKTFSSYLKLYEEIYSK